METRDYRQTKDPVEGMKTEQIFDAGSGEYKDFPENPIYLHEKKADKVYIVGMFAKTRDMCPFDDKDAEIWGMNDLYRFVPRVDVLFQVHSRVKIEEFPRTPTYLEWLQKNMNTPVYCHKHYEDIPMSIPYPLQEIVNEFGGYFTNGVSYLIALAIYMEYEEIHLYGIEMEHASEHLKQKPSVTYFIGLARGRGIKVWMPKESTLMRAPVLYGFEGEDMWTRTVTEKLNSCQEAYNEAHRQYLTITATREKLLGKVEAYEEMRTMT